MQGQQPQQEEGIERIWPGERIMGERVRELMGAGDPGPGAREKEKRPWPYDVARRAMFEVVGPLGRHCSRLEACGSLRRRRPEVGDLDLVAVASNYLRLLEECRRIGSRVSGLGSGVKTLNPRPETRTPAFEAGARLIRFGVGVEGGVLPVKVNIVRPDAWWLKVIYYTGSRANNERLDMLARRQGLILDWEEGLRNRETGLVWKRIEEERDLWKWLRVEWQEAVDRG